MNNCTLSLQQINTLKEKINSLGDERKIPELLNCLSSETRVKVLVLLKHQPEMSVCDLASVLDMSVSAISHQLRCLRDLEIVTTRRDSQNIFYSLASNEFILNLLGLI